MKNRIGLEDLALEGAELSEAELGEVSGGRWHVTWYIKGKPAEWSV